PPGDGGQRGQDRQRVGFFACLDPEAVRPGGFQSTRVGQVFTRVRETGRQEDADLHRISRPAQAWALKMMTARSASTPIRTRIGATTVVPRIADGRQCRSSGTSVPASTSSQRTIQPPESTRERTPPMVTRNRTSRTSSSRMKYWSASISRRSLEAASRRERVARSKQAAAPLRPEARKRPPRVQVSLQTGWLLTASKTPV